MFLGTAYACCSAPKAENLYIAKVTQYDTNSDDEIIEHKVVLEAVLDIHGISPKNITVNFDEFTRTKYFEVDIALGDLLLITLFDSSKFDKNGWPIKSSEQKNLALHPYLGMYSVDSDKADLALRFYKFHKGLNWSNDFKLIQTFFNLESGLNRKIKEASK